MVSIIRLTNTLIPENQSFSTFLLPGAVLVGIIRIQAFYNNYGMTMDLMVRTFPVSNIEISNHSLIKSLNITKFPSIFAISAKDRTVNEVGQLSIIEWELWLKDHVIDKEEKSINEEKVNDLLAFSSIENIELKSISAPILSTKKPNAISWNVFPNPCVDQISIKSDRLIQSPVHITVFNSSGELIYTYDFEFYFNNWTIDMSNIPPGTYFLKVQSEFDDFTRRIINVR